MSEPQRTITKQDNDVFLIQLLLFALVIGVAGACFLLWRILEAVS